jgi:hypothetical protein
MIYGASTYNSIFDSIPAMIKHLADVFYKYQIYTADEKDIHDIIT